MELERFFLYYGITLQIILCIFLFNTKLEWALLISMFYITIIFTYGLVSEISNQSSTNEFIHNFTDSNAIKSIKEIIKSYTGFDVSNYMKYLIVVPSLFNLASIKLITNYDGNKKIHKSKSKLKQLNRVKQLIYANIFITAIVIIFGLTPSLIPIAIPILIPLYSLGLLYIISLAELIASIIVYISY